jgi:hypothetical protein
MEPVLVNGKNYDWGNLTLMLFGTSVVVGFTEISYEVNQDSVNNYGAGYEPVSYGKKKKEYKDISLTLYTEELRAIKAGAPGGILQNIPPFSIKVMFSGDSVNFATDTLLNCRFKNDPFSGKQDDSMFMCKLNIAWAGIING